MSALMKVIDSFRGQQMLKEHWSLGDRALEEYNQLLLKQDELYKDLESLHGKLNAVVGAVQTLSGITKRAADAAKAVCIEPDPLGIDIDDPTPNSL